MIADTHEEFSVSVDAIGGIPIAIAGVACAGGGGGRVRGVTTASSAAAGAAMRGRGGLCV